MNTRLQQVLSTGKSRQLWQLVATGGAAIMLLGFTLPGVPPQAQPAPITTNTVTVNTPTVVASPEALPTLKTYPSTPAAQQTFEEGMLALKRFAEGDTTARDTAEEKFSKVIELDPTYPAAFFYKGYLESSYDNPTNPNAALEDIEKALALDPRYAEAYFLRADIYRQRGLTERWFADLNQAIAFKPDYLAARYMRALYYVRKDKWDQALPDLNKVIELMPGHVAWQKGDRLYLYTSPYYRLALVDVLEVYGDRAAEFARQQKWAAAIDDYSQAIKAAPDTAAMYFGRGEAYQALGNVKALEADLTKAIALNPGYLVKLQADLPRLNKLLSQLGPGTDELHTKLKILIGRVEQNSDEVQSPNPEAMADYEKGLKYLRKFEGLRTLDIAIADEMTNAHFAFDAAIDKDPEFAAAYLQRSRLGADYRSILDDLNQAIKFNPAYAEAYVARAQLLLVDKKASGFRRAIVTTPEEEAQGKADLSKALELKPNYYYALVVRARFAIKIVKLGETLADLNPTKLDEALVDLNQAVASLPPNISQLEVYRTYFWRGKVLLAKGMYREAIADLNQALDAATQFNPMLLDDIKAELYRPLHAALDKLEPGELRTQFEALVAKTDKGVVIDWGPSK